MVEQTPDHDSNHVYNEILRDPKIAGVVKDAHDFNELRESRGWQRLYQITKAKRDRWMVDIAKRLMMHNEKYWPKPTEIAFNQGFYEGAMFILEHPEHAERSLERAATLAWAMLQEKEAED